MVAGPVPDETKYTLEPIIRENVEPGTIVSSDGHYAYRDLAGDYTHGFVDHSAKEYVRGFRDTNSIEGHWSLLNCAIKGTRVHVSTSYD
jgi:transposase